jgi:hypothetical protein
LSKGVVFDVDLLLTPQGVLSGGRDTGAEFWGNADYTLNVDTGKPGLWPGGFFKTYAGSSFGESVLGDSGALVPVNTAKLCPEPDEPSTGLMHASFAQFLSPKFGVVAGNIFTLDAGAGEFAGNYRTQFLHAGLALPMSLALVPISAYGGGVVVLPWEGLVLSVLALDPSGTPKNNDVTEAFDDGVMVLATGRVAITPFGLRGTQKAGFMWSDKVRLSLTQDPSNLARFLLTEQFPRLGNPGPILQRILERFFPQLLVPVQRANREARHRDLLHLRRVRRGGEPRRVFLRDGDRRQRRGTGAPARHLRRRLGPHRAQRQVPAVPARTAPARARARGRDRDVLRRLDHAVAEREPGPSGGRTGVDEDAELVGWSRRRRHEGRGGPASPHALLAGSRERRDALSKV